MEIKMILNIIFIFIYLFHYKNHYKKYHLLFFYSITNTHGLNSVNFGFDIGT